MAAGDVRQGRFSRSKSLGTETITGLVGGSTFSYVRIKALVDILIGDNNIDPEGAGVFAGYRLNAGEIVEFSGSVDGTKVRFRGIFDSPLQLSAIYIFAIDNV